MIQAVRNESIHGDTTTKQECRTIRKSLLGIGRNGFFIELRNCQIELKRVKA